MNATSQKLNPVVARSQGTQKKPWICHRYVRWLEI
jgi:hypothetical protein